ncbi:trypsin-like peptidase domain-containing protein [Actinomycetospora chiangmaiensis]|uniref:trypsin-like peptidase domain-containing protein n=1 Tax=Actinomycetospora chiangmaiensis TaxID=402650 RepID=UPI00036FE78F|nr:trypsin-like peptidase domain-containing protein [Actinomycetospora chiangmaiensis]
MRPSLPSWKSTLAAVAVAGAALLATAPPALAQDGGGGPDPTHAPIAEKVSGEVLPAVDRLQITSAAGLLVNPNTGEYARVDAFSVGCTGFTVSSDGWIATAGHCVDPAMMAMQARITVANRYGAAGYDANAVYQQLQDFVFVDGTGNAAPAITVQLLPATANPGDKPMDAKVVDFQAYNKGDTALLKVDGHNMLSIEVAPGGPAPTGTPVMSVGYPGARDDAMDPSMTPTWKEGAVSSQQTQDGIAYTEVTTEMGHGMSGGPTVDQQGRAIGINSQAVGDGGNSFNFVAPTSRLAEMMARHGVPTAPSPVDAAYRSGMDLYYQGYYSDAVEQFDQVLALAPGNKAAVDYKNKAVQAHDQFGDTGLGLLGWGLIGGGTVLVLVIGGCVVGVVVSRRRRAVPTGPQVDVAQPGFGLPTGYQVPLQYAPAATPQYQQQYGPTVPQQAPAGFGAAPFGQTGSVPAAPASPPVGFPAPSAPAAPSTPRHEATTVAPEAPAVAVATPPSGYPAPLSDAPVTPVADAPTGPGHCPNCGAARAGGARFCGGCGVGLA